MWAFSCGVVSSGASLRERWLTVLAGVVLVGPLVCGTSQAVNDWFDRHVDAINEPQRPIPSGRIPGRWGLWLALGGTGVSLLVGTTFGRWGLAATCVALVLAWAYSMPPIRFKQNGWMGNLAVGLSYEGLAWVTGTALMIQPAPPPLPIIIVALLYSLGTHGIMTLNDFKSIEGDARMGVRSLPVLLGPERAATTACVVMLVPQLIAAVLMASWRYPGAAAYITAAVMIQLPLMRRLLSRPRELAPWYNGTGIVVFVSGMMAAAVAFGSA